MRTAQMLAVLALARHAGADDRAVALASAILGETVEDVALALGLAEQPMLDGLVDAAGASPSTEQTGETGTVQVLVEFYTAAGTTQETLEAVYTAVGTANVIRSEVAGASPSTEYNDKDEHWRHQW